MYRAKEKGKARYEIFDHGMHGKAVNRLKLESDLRDAVQMRQFVLHYQPIVSLHTGQLAGFEALVRWQSPERGMVPPLDFIPVLEETGLIVEMGEWAIFESLGQLKHWTDAGLASNGVTMAVNVSRRQLLSAHLSQTIAHALQKFEMAGERLEVEITESSVMVNREVAVHVLDQLRMREVHLSMDDFGTGHSSLSCLHQFPFTTLKIDREFVRDCAQKQSSLEVVRAILSLARVLELKVIAEGVETQEQMNLLRTLGCDFAQGYFIAKPMPTNQAEVYMQSYDAGKYAG
jgi:EAL domain-containing protein (putative c-di-GMP-specific phosphodiesterase class I)